MKKIIVLSCISLMLWGCNQEIVIENDLPYQEKLVVQGLLRAESAITVDISKTQPVNIPISKFVEITDAKVILNYPGLPKPDTLLYIGNGQYSDCDLLAFTGIDYSLDIYWNGKHCSAKTKIPKSPTVLKSVLHVPTLAVGDSAAYITCLVKPEPGYMYGAVALVDDEFSDFYFEDTLFTRVKLFTEVNEQGYLEVKTRDIPLDFYRVWRNFFSVKVFAYDAQIYQYYLTQNANLGGNNIFSAVGTTTRWNVDGSGIGLFIGYSSTGALPLSSETRP